MKIFITGATGFLGKKVMSRLILDPKIKSIVATSRKRIYHPSSKVKFHVLDLSDPAIIDELAVLINDCDAIIHLAGLYHFESDYSTNFQNNVLPAAHIVQAVQKSFSDLDFAPPIYFSSTFAVGLGTNLPLEETTLTQLPPRQFSYSYTKGLAERIFSDSPLQTFSFRLGALTGSPKDLGYIEKIDGPYTLLKILANAAKLPGIKHSRLIPVLADPEGMIPILTVDCAAKIFHEALFNSELALLPKAHLGVFDEKCVNIKEICDLSVKHFFPKAKVLYLKKIPTSLLWIEKYILKGAAEIFEFSLKPVQVKCQVFKTLFPQTSIPHLREYQDQFLNGFQEYQEGHLP